MIERPMRASQQFHEEMERIKDKRLILGKDRNRMATSKLLNLILSHVNWKSIRKSLIAATPEEVARYGK